MYASLHQLATGLHFGQHCMQERHLIAGAQLETAGAASAWPGSRELL